jgi:hypothetical protein
MAVPQPADEITRLGDFDWTQPAVNRLYRVPEGFMRDLTRTKIEEFAAQRQLTRITLETAEQGIEVGRQMMAEMIAGYSKAKQEEPSSPDQRDATTPVNPGTTSPLNEIARVPGSHP